MPYEKDLVALVPDKNAQFFVQGVLSRAGPLGLRPPSVQHEAHPLRDAGCLDADELLQSQANRYRHALVVVANRSRSGTAAMSRGEAEASIERRLAATGWNQRARAVVIDPGLDQWLLERELGTRPAPLLTDPHQALQMVLRQKRTPHSPELYRALGARLAEEGNPDPAWNKLVATLKTWFATSAQETAEDLDDLQTYEEIDMSSLPEVQKHDRLAKSSLADFAARIDIDPAIGSGKPRIRGHRIWVSMILSLLASGWSVERILENYPGISEADIRACIAFANEAVERLYPGNVKESAS